MMSFFYETCYDILQETIGLQQLDSNKSKVQLDSSPCVHNSNSYPMSLEVNCKNANFLLNRLQQVSVLCNKTNKKKLMLGCWVVGCCCAIKCKTFEDFRRIYVYTTKKTEKFALKKHLQNHHVIFVYFEM